ncbi:NADPH-dependent FMN reductase [Cohnella silvisoli]|uniref:NAD(P)H-dependent oxidoreductase n=1 Tax=Cohnella silvisoli TaxID=2873699 RepID=A0ABV1KZ35_9BACL|nr:NAD(P)H-dependent oxidoreductase [Cohnella silvisoli]MCD9024686.1 NAD(P)H-dependent oxidoreductase [Cohnella silvisoli]
MKITAIVGNPKSRSKTYGIAEEVLKHISANITPDGETADEAVVDLADTAPALLDWGNAEVMRQLERVCSSDIVIFASPTYKATYTGLLKLFVDQLPVQALANIIAIPVMVGGAPHHSLAVEAYLRPLLVETGAICPTRGLYVLDSQIDNLPDVIGNWYEASARVLRSVVVGKGA